MKFFPCDLLFLHTSRVGKAEVSNAVERSLSNLFHKAGDTASRNRDDAKSFTLEMASFPEVKVSLFVFCCFIFFLGLGQGFYFCLFMPLDFG